MAIDTIRGGGGKHLASSLRHLILCKTSIQPKSALSVLWSPELPLPGQVQERCWNRTQFNGSADHTRWHKALGPSSSCVASFINLCSMTCVRPGPTAGLGKPPAPRRFGFEERRAGGRKPRCLPGHKTRIRPLEHRSLLRQSLSPLNGAKQDDS